MAQKQEFTLEELDRMNKQELIQLSESLHIKTQNLSKSQIIKYNLGQRPSIIAEQQVVQEFDTVGRYNRCSFYSFRTNQQSIFTTTDCRNFCLRQYDKYAYLLQQFLTDNVVQ